MFYEQMILRTGFTFRSLFYEKFVCLFVCLP